MGSDMAGRLEHLRLQAAPLSSHAIAQIEPQLFAALRNGTAAEVIVPLQALCEAQPQAARCWWLLALLLREEQRHEAALAAVVQAQAGAGDDADIAALHAQIRYESGRMAAPAFEQARRLRPADPGLTRNHAGALMAEGQGAAAARLMEDSLTQRPGWIEGHVYLATLRRFAGEAARHDRGFAQAVRARPRDLTLRLGWFGWLAQCRQWDEAGRVVADARRELGDRGTLVAAALYLAAESGVSRDPGLFDALEDRDDPGIDLARVRHALRCGDPARASTIATRQLAGGAARMFWPYLSIAWRLLGDDRAAWLDRPDAFIAVMPLGLDRMELAALACLLRTLHGAAAPYPEQSVRGGTQTDRPLLFRHEPIMQRTRAAIEDAVRRYVACLPMKEARHPLLDLPRQDIRLAGSWSVRLGAQGHHACHTHPGGWISSALHIALPDRARMGPPPAGWLRFGSPPPDLGLDLPAYRDVAPKEGQLVLFPSTLWHGTLPFADGERLSLAFDVAPPRR